MTRHFLNGAAAVLIGIGAPAFAESGNGIVVELFTSQGCSSCPPADAFLAELVGQPGIIPLSMHVDYWDYIGWQDTFGSEEHANRQRAYARAAGRTMIYTPQMIISGGESVEGNQPAAVLAAITRATQLTSPVTLEVTRTDDSVAIRAVSRAPFAQAGKVEILRYRPEASVDIVRGENAGQSITYHNVVTDLGVLGYWSGEQPWEMQAAAAGPEGVVVMVQDEATGRILAAVQLN